MNSVQDIIANRIQAMRKEKGLTQEELASKLGVTFQAVSKWENGKAAPDILLLPLLADIFECPIDTLFARESKLVQVVEEPHYDLCTEFPWPDDDVLRGVVCHGRKILKKTDGIVDRFTFEVKGEIQGGVQSECNLSVHGGVSGGSVSGGYVCVWGGISGGVSCEGDLSVQGSISGGVICGGNLAVQNGISGGVNAAGDISCRGDITGKVTAEGDITVTGNIKAEKVSGVDITCRHLECEKIKGNISIEDEEDE